MRLPPPDPAPPRRRWRLAAVAVLPAAVAFLLLSADFRGRNSPVVDELAYLTAAKPVFQRGDFDALNGFGTAPLPILLEYGPAIRRYGDGVADAVWRDSPNDPVAIDLARLTTALGVGVPLLALVVVWVVARTGSAWPGGWAGLMLALSPTFVAHATVAGTDACFALFFLLALLALGRHAERPTVPRFLVAGALVGLAVAAKYSGVLLLPAAYLIGLVGHLRTAAPITAGGVVGRAVFRLPLRVVGLAAVAGVVAWGTTGFAWSARTVRTAAGVRVVRLPAPADGFARQFLMTTARWQEAFGDVQTRLNGRLYPRGHRLYYVYALACKSTLPELACVGLAAVAAVGRGPRRWSADGLAAALGLLVLAVAVSLSAKQLGVRYLLAAYPLGAVLAATALHRLGRGRGRLAVGVAVALLVGQAAEAVGSRPWHLSYMNRLAGGPERAVERLGICDADWGQGRRELAEFLRAEGETGVLFVPGNAADADFYYGVRLLGWADYPAPPCRYAAMTGACLAHPPDKFPRIADFTPLPPARVLGHCLFVYDLSDPAVWAAYKTARPKPLAVRPNTP